MALRLKKKIKKKAAAAAFRRQNIRLKKILDVQTSKQKQNP